MFFLPYQYPEYWVYCSTICSLLLRLMKLEVAGCLVVLSILNDGIVYRPNPLFETWRYIGEDWKSVKIELVRTFNACDKRQNIVITYSITWKVRWLYGSGHPKVKAGRLLDCPSTSVRISYVEIKTNECIWALDYRDDSIAKKENTIPSIFRQRLLWMRNSPYANYNLPSMVDMTS